MALQRLGDFDRRPMLIVAEQWSKDRSWLVRRAAVAGICEPRLLDKPSVVRQVLGILDRVTRAIAAASPDQRPLDDFRVLRQALVTAGALPSPPRQSLGSIDSTIGPNRTIPISNGSFGRTSKRIGCARQTQAVSMTSTAFWDNPALHTTSRRAFWPYSPGRRRAIMAQETGAKGART